MKRLVPLLLLSSTALAGPGPREGSAFDLRTPFPESGTLGRVIADGSNLRFERDARGTRRIFVGTNLTGMACFPTSETQARDWARDLAVRGYNCVRLHHIDWVIRDRGWDFKVHADRFIAALKREGIYVTIDLFSDRARDRNAFKRGVLNGDSRIRADWLAYSRRLLTQPSQVRGCLAWKDEPAILGLCPINEDDPRFIGASVDRYEGAYRWMVGEIRAIGFKGLLWGLNSGVDARFLSTGKRFDAEDFHVYWDHPQGDESLDTSGVRQHWQFPVRRLADKPWISTEWGSLAFNRLRGETGLFFAGQLSARGASMALSFALATNEAMMSDRLAPIDPFGFHSDPVRLATDRAMVLLMRRRGSNPKVDWNWQAGTYRLRSDRYDLQIEGEGSNRAAEFLGSLDSQPTQDSRRLLLIRLGDAQNDGFRSRLIRDRVVFKVERKGGLPVREISATGSYELRSNRRLRAWSLDPYTGRRLREVRCRERSKGVWEIRTESLNTEVAES